MKTSALLLLFLASGDWTHVVESPRPVRKGKPQSPTRGHLWIPAGVETLRGLLVAGKIRLERDICTNPAIRQACAEKGLGILYYEPHISALFNYRDSDCEDLFLASLAQLARASSHLEIERIPWLTVGHSTGGIFCRNVAYWKPDRVMGILHIKSGNFQDHIQDEGRSLAGVPFLALNGEFEEYGPAGGDLKGGKRARYSLNPQDKSKSNQTQWIMIRMQMMERRRRNADNLMSLVIHRDGGHGGWSDDLTAITAQFIRSAADARLPGGQSRGKNVVACKRLTANLGWLTDADIKAPRHNPAPYIAYTGDKILAFWHIDRVLAEMIDAYHRGPWKQADPTAGQSREERFVPPEILQDRVDIAVNTTGRAQALAGGALSGWRPRVIVSTDVGGSDPDDFQSMVHLLVYADVLDIEGLISSPPNQGRARHLHEVLDAYEKDYPRLKAASTRYPRPAALRNVVKQGAIDPAPKVGYGKPTEGSRWIIERARAKDKTVKNRPLWILVWGSITDVAQALHDDPSIKKHIRIYSIGSWNTRNDRAARDYIYKFHGDLWWIESDTSFRGMYRGGEQGGDLGNRAFVDQHVIKHGALGDFFFSKKQDIKMGDTPSLLYLLRGNPEDPSAEHWGGSFQQPDPENRRNYWYDRDKISRETVSKWRVEYLRDWQSRMAGL